MSYKNYLGFSNHIFRIFFFIILFAVITGVSVSARQVTVTWDPNSEPDLSHYIVYWGTASGNYISNSGNIGLVTTYTATIPDAGQYFFAVTAVDNAGLESDYSNEVFTQEESIPLPPVANAGIDQTKAEGQAVTLNGSASSDPDGSIASYLWTQTGGTAVTLSSTTAAQPTFTAPNVGQAGATLTFSLTVTDNQGLQSSDTVVINVTWVNAAPTANAGADQTKAEGLVVTLNGSASSDPDGSTLTYLWTQTGGTAVTLSSTTAAQPTFTAPNVGQAGATLTFSLKVTDPQGLQSTDSVTVNITWVNIAPIANAGTDQTKAEGLVVTLNGSASSDPDGSTLTYLWTQTGGTAVTLSSTTAAQPTFTAPNVSQAGATLTFSLKVTDPQGLQSTDTVVINVTWVNAAPIANAGADQTKAEGLVVTLNGSASSDPDGSTLTYLWTQTGGTAVTLSSSTVAQPTFTAPDVAQAGATLTFSLKVTDPQGLQSTDSVTVNITWVNVAPIANAGTDQIKAAGQVIALNGSASSDPDGSAITYQWAQTGGTAITLSSATVAQPTFTAPSVDQAGATLTFSLKVTDPQGLQSTDTVVINVTWVNAAPIANAGPDQNIDEGMVVTLNGSNSIDQDGTIASYLWTQASGTPVTLNNATSAQPTFTAPYVNPEGTTLTFNLTVTDSQGLTSTDSCIINVVWVNDPPVADAGDDQNINEGQLVTLYSIDSIDPDGTIAAWQWKQISGTPVTLSSSIVAQPTFTAPYVTTEGTSLTFELTVTDSQGLKSSDSVIINVLWVNDPPIANAGTDQSVISGKLATLNGSGSVDNDGYISAYMWKQVSGTPVTLNNPATAKPTFTPYISSQSETLVFQLVVTDNGGLKSSSECKVNVSKPTRTIKSRWNLVTIPKTTQTTTVNSTFTPIMENVISIWSYDNGSWKVYDPKKPETSTLNALEPGKAVWMNMSQDAELNISGDGFIDPVNLTPGWNLVGYNSSASRNVSDAISNIAQNVKSVWTYADGKWKVFDPKNPGLSDLNVLEPGFGYWVKVDKQCSWTY